MDAHVLDLDVRQPCIYCRLGEYKIRVDPRWFFDDLKPQPEPAGPNYWLNQGADAARRYGVQAHNGAPWLILQCDHCGNVQMFQLSEARGVDFKKNWNLRQKRG